MWTGRVDHLTWWGHRDCAGHGYHNGRLGKDVQRLRSAPCVWDICRRDSDGRVHSKITIGRAEGTVLMVSMYQYWFLDDRSTLLLKCEGNGAGQLYLSDGTFLHN